MQLLQQNFGNQPWSKSSNYQKAQKRNKGEWSNKLRCLIETRTLKKSEGKKHKEQLNTKIIKEQPIKCYICGFQLSSETAFQIHT